MSPSSTLLRTSRPSIRLLHSPPVRHVSSAARRDPSSSSSYSSSSSSSSSSSHQWRSLGFMRWVSGIAVGSSLGAAFFYNLPSSSSSDHDFDRNLDVDGSIIDYLRGKSVVSFADANSSLDSAAPTSISYKRPKFLFRDSYRRKVFFNYEKRIRTRSPPEKVFEYFASVRNAKGEVLMTPADLMRAVVPVFPPSESDRVREGYLPGEQPPGELRCLPSEFFMLFDVNNDGLISFKEYIFFVTLLSIPESNFSIAFKMFDIDNNGEIDRDEFKKVMALMRSQNRQGASHRDGLRPGIRIGGSVENGGLVEYFFGKDGDGRLHVDKFVEFLRHLHDEMLRLEFSHYDYKSKGSISAKDFALSMVASAETKHINKLLDRVDELDNDLHLRNVRITEDEFRKFAELRKKLEPFALALFTFGEVTGLLTKADFQRAASQICGVSLSDNMVDIIFHVFDTNRDGNLSGDEFLRVMAKREWDIAQPIETGMFGFLSCCRQCAKGFSLARLLSP